MALAAPALPPAGMDLPPEALEQIAELQREKASRTPAQRKLSSALVHEARRQRGQSIGRGLDHLRSGIELDDNGQVVVDISAVITPELQAAVESEGGEVLSSFSQYQSMRARLPIQSVEVVAELAEVRGVREATRPMLRKEDTSEGDVAHRADQARAAWSVDGTGIKVGVLSDSVDYLARVQRKGDLPAVTVLEGQNGINPPDSTGEGTAMLEIVYDLAPGATLWFATAFGGEAQFAANIVGLRNAGCDIIVDDVSYFAEPVFQDGVIAQAVDQVVADGALYFSAAGNSGNLNDGESGVWEGDFVDAAEMINGITDIPHAFGANNFITITGDAPSLFTLQWADPWGASGNDYDLYLLSPDFVYIWDSSTTVQDGTGDPIEAISSAGYNDTGNILVVTRKDSAAQVYFHLNTHRGRLDGGTAGQISGHPAAAGAMAVAAVEVDDALGGAFADVAGLEVEYYSSDGPRRIFFDADGNELTPGDVSSTGGEVRQKPELTAADCVSTYTNYPDFFPFCGTSAAAPHAGAIAALIWSQLPTATNGEVRDRLLSSALDIEASGVDRDSGAGIADAYDALLTAIELISFEARSVGGRVALSWRTSREVDNLGFHLYREQGQGLLQLTPEPVAGAALWSGAGSAYPGGRGYRWWDDPGPTPEPARYWLEDIALDGQRTWHGPAVVQPAGDEVDLEDSLMLGQIDQGSARVQERRARAAVVRERLQARPVRAGPAGRGRTQVAGGQEKTVTAEEPFASPWPEASSPGVKIVTQAAGWYEVSGSELFAAGLAPDVDPQLLQLATDGQQQAIEIRGLVDGRLQPTSRIGFYARELDTPWTGQRISWLLAGDRPGLRVAPSRASGTGGRSVGSAPATVVQRESAIYFAALLNGDQDNFFGPLVTASGVEWVVALPAPDPSFDGVAHLQLLLQGVSEQAHRVLLALNGQPLGEAVFSGRALASFDVELPQAWLLDGDNLLQARSVAGETDVALVESTRIDYRRLLRADGGALACDVAGARNALLDGFGPGVVRALDLAADGAILELAVTPAADSSSGEVRVRLPDSRAHHLFAFAAAAAREPVAVLPARPTAWHATSPGADLLIIAHPDLLEPLRPLVAQREWQRLAVALIDVTDLYDEFSFGHKDPHALRAFLAHARTHWQIPPRFVLLVGDASFDPRDHLGFGDRDLLPTKLVDTRQLETATDGWFADFDGSAIPALALGRLPARNAGEAALMVDKILAQEAAAGEEWTGQALVIADVDPRFDFAAGAARVASALAGSFAVEQMVLPDGDIDSSRARLLDALDSGPALVNYFGHGSVEVWFNRAFFKGIDARALGNGGRTPVVVAMTCLSGLFHDLYTESMAEAFLRAPDGGAVAVWASSGLTDAAAQQVLDREFASLLVAAPALTLGEAVMLSTSLVNDLDVRRSFNLLGDPCLRLGTGVRH
ncbi:MAG: S8 family serine peptidase [Deltaproteobacteria bacterium]|nr:S8 family serine peptidase [Deltaproteobacteria bacterium]